MAQTIATEEGLEQLELLEEKIERAIELLQAARAEKEALKEENAQIRRQLAERDKNVRILQEQLYRFQKERENVQARVQKILEQVDTLMQAAADAE